MKFLIFTDGDSFTIERDSIEEVAFDVEQRYGKGSVQAIVKIPDEE